ncbi:MAG TPA: Gmad2 immunoglobulin-like domain-containing protein [Caldisericia bacterium]|nr:Gmad2 immunoglobulin-like domain-containing protein [Caldisericia bacterium]HRU74320.1 Gmad2 immunoglobulin-like domain-containing protein [Caldisericia bacterium]
MKHTNIVIVILIIIIISILALNFYQRYSITKKINDAKDLIVIESPEPYEKVQNPIHIKGKARGNFFFEATFPIRIEDENGNILTTGYVETKEDWMTDNFVSFETYLNFSKNDVKNGFIVFEKANPSGLEENKFEVKIPVYFQ